MHARRATARLQGVVDSPHRSRDHQTYEQRNRLLETSFRFATGPKAGRMAPARCDLGAGMHALTFAARWNLP